MKYIKKIPYALFLILFTTCGSPNDNKEKSSTGSEKSTPYFLSDSSYYYLGKNGLGVDGYDVTSYFTKGKAIEGDDSNSYEYEGVAYHFDSEQSRSLFISNPEKYLPQFGGYCAFGLGMETGKGVGFNKPGKYPSTPTSFKIIDDKLYLFHDSPDFRAKERWEENELKFLRKADRTWETIHPRKEDEKITVLRQMAEFEDVEAIRLIWPTYDHKNGESVEEVTLAIIDALVKDTKIIISCADDAIRDEAKNTLTDIYPNLTNLFFEVIPSIEIWVRDMGPIFVETEGGGHAVADFNFNSWGYADTLDAATKIEEKYDEKVAKILGIPLISSPMISEGGNREVNGKGTLMVTEKVESGRNPTMSRAEMEAEYERMLGSKNVIWLEEGLVEDTHTFLGPLNTAGKGNAYTVVTTNGHVDEFARFVNDSTILLAAVDSTELSDPLARENHHRLEKNFEILSGSRDQDGNLFAIKRLPLPSTILTTMNPGDYVYDYIKTLNYQDGSPFPKGNSITVVAPASYLNFIISNKVIVGQKYWRDGMPESIRLQDEKAKAILGEVFPERKVVMIDALPVNLGGGGLHCISMHHPKIILE